VPVSASASRQDCLSERRSFVRTGARGTQARYDLGIRDVFFIALVVAFFAVATVFVRACEFVVGRGSGAEEARDR
jgi:hypothetical protein